MRPGFNSRELLLIFFFQDHCRQCKNWKQDGSCVDECTENHYGYDASKECLPCHGDCKTCFGPAWGECRECKSLRLVIGPWVTPKCVETCPEGFYINEATKTCHPCHNDCHSCWGSTPDLCYECRNFRLITDNGTSNCVSTCPELYPRVDPTDKLCIKADEVNLILVISITFVVTFILIASLAFGAFVWWKKRQQLACEVPSIKLDTM